VKYSPATDGVTQSLLAKFLSCRRCAELYLKRWSLARTKSSLIFGSCFHFALQHIHQYLIDNRFPASKKEFRERLSEVGGTAVEHYRRTKIAMLVNDFEVQELETHCDTILLMLPYYLTMYYKDYSGRKWTDSETKFDQDFGGFKLRGKYDGIFELRKNKEIWIQESKTKAKILSTLETTLPLNFQIQFYALTAELRTGKKISGTEFNVIRRPGQKQGDDFLEKVEADLRKRPEHYFMQWNVTFDEEDKRQFRKELLLKLAELDSWRKGDLATYKNEFNCGGIYTCEYVQACTSKSLSGYYRRKDLFPELEDEV